MPEKYTLRGTLTVEADNIEDALRQIAQHFNDVADGGDGNALPTTEITVEIEQGSPPINK